MGCSATVGPCQWLKLGNHLHIVENREVWVHHSWAWFNVYEFGGSSVCGCELLHTACSQTDVSTAQGTGPLGQGVCQLDGFGTCNPSHSCNE